MRTCCRAKSVATAGVACVWRSWSSRPRNADTKGLVQQLADGRLIVASVNEVTGLEEVEVAHEG